MIWVETLLRKETYSAIFPAFLLCLATQKKRVDDHKFRTERMGNDNYTKERMTDENTTKNLITYCVAAAMLANSGAQKSGEAVDAQDIADVFLSRSFEPMG